MLPRFLIIDDLFGRNLQQGRNVDRENICAHFLWRDISNDSSARASQQKVLHPVAEAVFFRGQTPASSTMGNIIENDLQSSLAKVHQGWTKALDKGKPPWTMVLLDLCFYTGEVTAASNHRTQGMPEGRPGDDDPRSYFGLTLLDAIHREFPELPCMILSSKPREEVSLEFSRRGALGFIDRTDPRGPELLEEAVWQHGLVPDSSENIVGNSLPILLALREARRAARHSNNILICGERGSGKELLANYIHHAATRGGKRQSRPFITVNSAVFTPHLFASELFGIEPKTATGVNSKIGLIEIADKGDLFLDEIADMPSEVQAAMLRVLQDRQITPVGARTPKKIDVRFLSATNVDLEIENRTFRPDLLDRLRIGGSIYVPPLRERENDIPLLTEKFVREAENARKGIMHREVTLEALGLLKASDWPGNIRDLRSCIFDAVNCHLDVEHLVPDHLRIPSKTRSSGKKTSDSLFVADSSIDRSGSSTLDLDSFLGFQDQLTFNQDNIGKWSSRLYDIQHSSTKLLARYLLAALEATKRHTPEHPEGVIQIHPAVKLITGSQKITASKAADTIKRILTPLEKNLDGDLLAALKIALRLRPRSTKSST